MSFFRQFLCKNSSLHHSISLLLLRMPRSKRCGTNNSPLFQFCALISGEAQPDDRHRAKMSLPFVVAVLASCSYIIAADQKSGEVMFTCCQTEHSNVLIIALPIAYVTQQWHRRRWESLISSMSVSSIPYAASMRPKFAENLLKTIRSLFVVVQCTHSPLRPLGKIGREESFAKTCCWRIAHAEKGKPL